jgi:DNA-directed RNA polymerase specialized sigma24 family protein
MNTAHATRTIASAPVSLETLPAKEPQNDKLRSRPVSDLDPFTRGYRRLLPKLRAACFNYVGSHDVDDLVQDVMTVASRHPARMAASDSKTLSWLIGIAKRCAPAYDTAEIRRMPLDELLAGECGDDLEARGFYEDVTELEVELWGRND